MGYNASKEWGGHYSVHFISGLQRGENEPWEGLQADPL